MSKVGKENLVTLATFSGVFESKIVQSMLESEGIPCFMQDENIIGMNWMFSSAVGGVKLKVRESDLDEARLLLSGSARMVEVPAFSSDRISNEGDATEWCPVCRSEDVVRDRVSKRAFFLTWIFLGFPLPFFRRPYRCLTCFHTWKQKKLRR